MSDWIMTFTGKAFYPAAPRVEDVCIDDIAHALSSIVRYGGHARRPYSVAQHSVLVSHACPENLRLYGLLHDAAEAYLGDVPSPLKHSPAFEQYRVLEERVTRAVYEAFGLDPNRDHGAVKLADKRMLRTEQRDLMPPPAHGEKRDDVDPYGFTVRPCSFAVAKFEFLKRFAELTGAPAPDVRRVLA